MKEKSKHMNIPKIRFKGFEDTWKNDKIGNIGSVLMCKRIFKSQTTSIGDIPFYKIGTFGSTADAFISENLFNEYKTRFSYPQYGDILLSAAGTIGRIVEYKGEKAYFQDSNIVWVKVNGKIKNQFLKYIYSCIKWNGLEGSTIKRLYNNNILETAINYPSPEEQQKIASYFQSLDSLIQITSKKLASLKQIKAASLQSMFPREGETVPKVRFKGFEGEWDKVKLSTLGQTYSGLTGKTKEDFNFGDSLYIPFLNVLLNPQIDESNLQKVKVENNEKQNEIHKGDILFNTSSETPEEVGLCSVFMSDIKKVYLNSFCFGFRLFNNLVDPSYIVYLLRSQIGRKLMLVLAQGATRYNLSKKSFLNAHIIIPTSQQEQQKIAFYFCNLDKQISLQTQRLEKLKQIKAACLDKMFV